MRRLGSPRSPRRSRRGDVAGSRFRRGRRSREEYASKLVQSITLTLLCAALIWLIFVSTRLIRAHFLEESGSQAWLLPISIGLILLFLLYRLMKLWGEVKTLGRASRDGANTLNNKDVR